MPSVAPSVVRGRYAPPVVPLSPPAGVRSPRAGERHDPARHDPEEPVERADRRDAPGRGRRPRWLRWTIVGLVAVAALVAVGVAVWVALLPDAEAEVIDAVLDDPDLAVTVTDDLVTIEPADGEVDGTVVFYPGAGVPPAAYLPTWAPVVEQVGVRVAVPAMPLRLAVLDSDAADDVRAGLPDDGPWWVAGHSLGGAMAASFLTGQPADDWDGLVLWAAYPAGDGLADRDDLAVASVAGGRDGLTTPAEVEDSRVDLPADATITIIEGVSHAQFGAYGEQRGDGEPTVPDDVARDRIATATADAIGAP